MTLLLKLIKRIFRKNELIRYAVLSFLFFGLTIFIAVQAQYLPQQIAGYAFAQTAPIFATPTLYCLGSCPEVPSITNVPSAPAVNPSVSQVIPPGNNISPSIDPCVVIVPVESSSEANNSRREGRERGWFGGFFQQLLKFLQELMGLLLRLIGQNPIPEQPAPAPTAPLPLQPGITQNPLQPSPTTNPCPSISPTAVAQPTSVQPSPSSAVNPTQPVGVSPTATPGLACSVSGATGSTATQTFPVNAVGDGRTDNYNVIQTAINNAGNAGGGIVTLPAGTFVINGHLTMRDNVKLQGAGPLTIIKAGSAFLNSTGAGGYSVISTNGASNVTIANFTADQSGDTLDGNSINRFRGFLVHVSNSTNVIVDGVYTRNPFTYSIVAEDSTKFCFKNNNTLVATSGKYNQLDGLHVLNSSFGDVINNTVDQGLGTDGDDGLVAHTIGGSVHDVAYIGNKVRGGQGGSGMQLALTDPGDEIYKITIQNNEFWESPRGIRTGYYESSRGIVHDITIGGSPTTGNYVHDNFFNNTNPGDVVNIYGANGDPAPYNIVVTNNRSCNAGSITVVTGTGNVVKDNTDCK